MPGETIDFLDAMARDYSDRYDFIDYIQSEDKLEELKKDLNLIGSVSGHNRANFLHSLESHFNIVDEQDNLLLLWASKEQVPYYVSIDDTEFPIFFTAANKTDEIPKTLGKFLKDDPAMSRMWVGKREMERLRQKMVRQHDHILIPQFTAKRSKHADIPAKKRPNYDRTIRYWADDGLEVFRHVKNRYGVLPTNIQFEQPGEFKCQLTQEGVFTALDDGVDQLSDLINDTITRLNFVKEKIDTAEYEEYVEAESVQDVSFPYSKPWAIQLENRPTQEDIKHFEGNIAASNLQFKLLEFDPQQEDRAFDAELMDTTNYGRTTLKTKESSIRVYPRGDSFIDESIRVYNFVDDHIDPNLEAIQVA